MKALLTVAVLALGLSASAADTATGTAPAAGTAPSASATAPAATDASAPAPETGHKVAKAGKGKLMDECKSENPSASKKDLNKCVAAKKKAMK